MNEFEYNIVEEAAKQMYIRALCDLPPDVRDALKKAAGKETNPTAQATFKAIFKTIEIADEQKTLICQDTGLPIYMIKIGSRFPWNGSEIKARLTRGAERATREFPFRGSSTHPLNRVNPQTSVGEGLPVMYFDFVPDTDYLDILMAPKGSGSENMSMMKMFYPAHGIKALKKFVIDAVFETGANPCPPGIIGVGIGGTADLVMRLAKEAIVRPVGQRNKDPEVAKMEADLEEAINTMGRGPMGLGGDITTLAVHIETAYTHITQNPIAINTQCWPARRSRARIFPDGTVEYGY
ncbi:MAG: fumarate hydratase [Deltaproteobacteria bacterium]|jgi:tartrate/fumarate subfamily iron-sulfur-dependent hydro-lyase alpha chain|nr:fumarate hydratase [Deltaproteobacteria bacterium]MBT4642725.1 fumarate hydratase [Deltaproteobacteria bacterium]MBT6501971.1 fumarate hydratase [Deltaproteobacteria bacterium]MBT7154990.1 fumarate hydratase [Deltaproteobacteria bacterium]MBT7710741.1 fumarate hydratase [Deltaproteobacteria bacterium]